ncbi:MAG: hypothetical protein K2M20_07955, partial [Lachnospiraceae bacterium]|nr:hypothetical protein [Lachnospiraceae bacterium]
PDGIVEAEDRNSKNGRGGNGHMIMEIISILLGVFLLGAIDYGSGGVNLRGIVFLLDFPSLIIILAFTAPVLFRGGIWKDFLRAWRLLKKNYTCHLSEIRRSLDVVEMLQKQVLCAGIASMLLSFIHILGGLSDLASLGPHVAVAILTMLYAVVFEMLLLPLQIEAKRRIADYMQVDTEEITITEDGRI